MRNLKNITNSIELNFSKIAKKMNKKNKIFFSLGLGEPDFNTPEFIINAAYKGMKKGFTKYSSPEGIYGLRKEISKKLKKENNIIAKLDEIIVTSGSKMALTLVLMSLLNKKDEIIYISPCYTSYLPQIILSNNEVRIKKISLDKKTYLINFKRLKKIINKNTKAILINYPHNPTGQILEYNQLKELEKLMLKYKKCYLISDEIYEKLNFSKIKSLSPSSLKSIHKRVVTINGFSKAYSMTGWRIGYCHANKQIIKNMIKIQQHINTNVPVFTQLAALAAYQGKSNHINQFNKKLYNNYNYLCKILRKNKKIDFANSYGGLFVFLNIKKIKKNSDTFCVGLLKKYSVSVTPGTYFGKDWKYFVRISLSQNYQKFKKAIKYLDKYINEIS
jgi:aspartate aminotransferase